MNNPFATPEMALGYASSRPPIHPLILERAASALGPPGVTLDLGCGAGLSTRAVLPYATRTIGLEPSPGMLRWAPALAPGASFVAAAAEHLPFPARSIWLITAAGSLNYVSLDAFFPEARRVLAPAGRLLVYDFATGRRFAGSPALDAWFARFLDRYPPTAGQARVLDPAILATLAGGFEVVAQESFELALSMTLDAYLDYLLTNTNIAAAAARGALLRDIRQWCHEGLASLWGTTPRSILFPGYWACLQ